jgi:transcriptional regulator with XRE-family HTH domain
MAGMSKGGAVSARLRTAIKAATVSRYRIAKETGVNESALSRFVAGRSLDLTSADKLAAFLGLELVASKRKSKGKVK